MAKAPKQNGNGQEPDEPFIITAGSNTAPLEKQCRDAMDELDKLDDRSTEINDERKAIRSSLKAAGINVKAFEAARKYRQTDPNKRINWDETYQLVRRAMGLQVPDIFTHAAEKQAAEGDQPEA